MQLVDVEERQTIKDFEDSIVDMLLVLDSTLDTISCLFENYKQFCLDTDANPVVTSSEDFDPIAFAFQEKHREVTFNRKKIETLQTKVQGMSSLVSKHPRLSLMPHQNTHIHYFSPRASWTSETVKHSSSWQKRLAKKMSP